jgi:hypothetical protein
MKKKLLSLITLLLFLGGGHLVKAQTTFNVTSTSLTGPGSFLEAVENANDTPGPDIIQFDPDLRIDLTSNDRAYREGVFHITESVTIDGAGSTVFSNPTWVSTAGDINNDDDADNPGTIINTPAMRFLRIGNRGRDNSDIDVRVENLNCEQLNNFAKAQDGVSLTLENVTVQGNRSIAPTQDAFISGSFENLTIKNSTLSNSVTFAEAAYVGNSLWTFAGGIAGNGNLEMENVTMRNNQSAGAVLWTGGTVTIVSSRFIYAGGIQVLDSDATIINSAFDFGFEGDVGYNSVVAGPGASIDLIASTVVTGFHGSSPDYNGLPLQAYGGTINLTETAVYGGASNLPEGDLPGLAYYATEGGAFTADDHSWVSPVDDQSANDLRDLFDNSELLTEDPGLSRDFLPYPQSITPLAVGTDEEPGVLIDVIDGGLFFDGSEITLDVLGNARVDGNEKRDIGAVQLNLAPHLAVESTREGAVGLVWNKPLDPVPPLTGYEICYGTGTDPDLSGAAPCPGTIVDVPGADKLTATVENLVNGTPYWFYVRGVSPAAGPWSNGVTDTPFAPIEPPDVTATPGDREVQLSWPEPAAGGHPGPLLYSVVYRPVGTDAWVAGPSLLSDLTSTIPGLMNGTPYEFGVYATANDGAKSELGSATATPFKPTPPIGDEDCTRSQGYWKTHSEFGPAPYNDTWALIFNPDGPETGANTPFFESGQTYYEMINAPVRNNAYYILAKQYIAAELNFLQGADESDAQDAFDQAKIQFGEYKPEDIKVLKKSDPTRKMFVGLAETLEEYNTGVIGPGYCESEETTAMKDSSLKADPSDDELLKEIILYYPNPVDNMLFIETNEKFRINIFTTYGGLLIDAENKTSIDLSNLKSGMYILRIEIGDKVLNGRILKN